MRWAALVLVLGACASTTETQPDAPTDVGVDAVAADAGRDAPVLDAGLDASAASDGGRDASLDAGADSFARDVGGDAPSDAGPDAPSCTLDPGSGTAAEVAAAEACALCSYYARCGIDVSSTFLGSASCTDFWANVDEGGDVTLQALIDAGRARYDVVAVARCTAIIANAPCGQFFGAVEGCAVPFTLIGTVAEGDACVTDVECASGLCDDPPGCGNSGVCRAAPAVGDSCDPLAADPECILPAECMGGICTAPTFSHPGDACTGGGSCPGSELDCWGGTCHAPADATIVGLGAACTIDGQVQCAPGLVCPNAIAPTCQPGDVAVGGACTDATPEQCTNGAWCNGGVCTALPGVGSDCSTTYRCAGAARCGCPTNATCMMSEYVCSALHHLGDACTNDTGCWSNACVGGVCVPRPLCD